MKHSTKAPTKAEQAWLDMVHAQPCAACIKEKRLAADRGESWLGQPMRTEAHHLVDKGTREHSGGHMASIPLCGWHHRGELLYPLSGREMFVLYGPSLAKHKRSFVATYGTDREMLEDLQQQKAAA